jgi:hypothetical protein
VVNRAESDVVDRRNDNAPVDVVAEQMERIALALDRLPRTPPFDDREIDSAAKSVLEKSLAELRKEADTITRDPSSATPLVAKPEKDQRVLPDGLLLAVRARRAVTESPRMPDEPIVTVTQADVEPPLAAVQPVEKRERRTDIATRPQHRSTQRGDGPSGPTGLTR